MAEYEQVLETPELGPGESREVEVNGRPVLVVNIGQIYYAMDARCPESGTGLELRRSRAGDRLICPTDRTEYAVPSGERLSGDGHPLRRYDVRIEGNEIRVGPPLD